MLNEYIGKRKFFWSKAVGAQGIHSLARPFFCAEIVTLIIKIRKKPKQKLTQNLQIA